MKKYIVLFFAIVLIVFSNINVEANDSLSLGEVVDYKTLDINNLKYEYFDVLQRNSDKQKIFHVSFDPNNANYEMVLYDWYRPDIYGKSNIFNIALKYENDTGRKVIAAFNGDFFMSTGEPVGAYVKNKFIYHLSDRNGFGFNNKGEVYVGPITSKGYIAIELNNNNQKKPFFINKINESPSKGEISIFYSNDKQIEMNTPNTGKYLIRLNEASEENKYEFPLYGEPYRLIKGEKISNQTVKVLKGYVGIEINNKEAIDYFYENFNFCNTKATILKILDKNFDNLDYYIGGGHKLIVDNEILPEGFDEKSSHDTGTHPRTTIGLTNKDQFFITVIDGRQPDYSQGITITEQATLARELNAKYAIELDGGGSSSIVLRIDDELQIMNKPSDGQLRPVSNAVLIVEKEARFEITNKNNDNCNPITDDLDQKKEITNEDNTLKTDNNSIITVITVIFLGISTVGFIILGKDKN